MNRIPAPELLDRYFSGECTDAEVAVVREYLAGNPEQAWLIADFRERLEAGTVAHTPAEVRALWTGLKGRLIAAGQSVPRSIPASRTRAPRVMPAARPRYAHWAIAAGLLIATGLTVWRLNDRTSSSSPVALLEPASTVATSDFHTANGQRSTVRMPDGSEILLNVGTRVRIPNDYGKGKREVYLEGEAQFTVRHDSTAPFLVYAGKTKVLDIGTVFVVRAYPDDRRAHVAVVNGIVEVHPDSMLRDSVRLHQGDVATLSGGRTAVEHDADLRAYTDWIDDRLVFERTPLREALVELGRWYGYTFELADPSLGAQNVTATFEGHAVTQEVIDLLAATLGARAERRGTVVRLIPMRTAR